jgi:multisubunit Na+/H+ antiporter MnhE subunit
MSWKEFVVSLGFGTAISASVFDLAGIPIPFKIRIAYTIIICIAIVIWCIFGRCD